MCLETASSLGARLLNDLATLRGIWDSWLHTCLLGLIPAEIPFTKLCATKTSTTNIFVLVPHGSIRCRRETIIINQNQMWATSNFLLTWAVHDTRLKDSKENSSWGAADCVMGEGTWLYQEAYPECRETSHMLSMLQEILWLQWGEEAFQDITFDGL